MPTVSDRSSHRGRHRPADRVSTLGGRRGELLFAPGAQRANDLQQGRASPRRGIGRMTARRRVLADEAFAPQLAQPRGEDVIGQGRMHALQLGKRAGARVDRIQHRHLPAQRDARDHLVGHAGLRQSLLVEEVRRAQLAAAAAHFRMSIDTQRGRPRLARLTTADTRLPMNIVNVLFPVVVEDFASYRPTADYYRRVLGLPLKGEFQHAGFTVSWLGPMVVVGAEVAAALEVARQVNAIFIVDDLEEAWRQLQPESEVLVAPEMVPSGGRFVVRHTKGDRRVIEYLDLRNVGE